MSNMAEIRVRSDELYEQYLVRDPEILEEDGVFAAAARALVADLQESARKADCREDYDWVRQTLEKWRVVLVAGLGEVEDVEIPLPERPLRPASPRIVWRGEDVETWVRDRAFALAKDRAIARESLKRPEEILRETPSTESEQDEDWRLANLSLAADVLYGSIDLTSMPAEFYERLEGCWLEDIKRFKAYLRWQERGGKEGEGEDLATKDWEDSCNEVRDRIVRAGAKLPVSRFDPVRHYLVAMYLPDRRMDPAKVEPVIAAKARRLAEEGSTDDVQNWFAAGGFVRQFYGNVLAAVEGDAEACRQVAVAVGVCKDEPGQPQIVNAFEAALTAAFVEIPASEQTQAALG